MIKPRHHLEQHRAYLNLNGDHTEPVHHLDKNENPMGMSAKIEMEIIKNIRKMSQYSNWAEGALKKALAEHHKVDETDIVLGNGSSELLRLVASTYLDSNTSSIYSEYGFDLYRIVIALQGAKPIKVQEKGYTSDLNGMLNAIRADTRVIWLANPNNPTGTYLEPKAIVDFLKQLPSDILLVLDEAYVDYVSQDKRLNSSKLVAQYPNCMVLRTFSKIYGLAGLRVGYAIADPRIASVLNNLQLPVSLNIAGLIAARTALWDQDFVQQSYRHAKFWLSELRRRLSDIGVSTLSTEANFLTLKVNQSASVNALLKKQGIAVRSLEDYGLPEYIRVSVASEFSVIEEIIHVLKKLTLEV